MREGLLRYGLILKYPKSKKVKKKIRLVLVLSYLVHRYPKQPTEAEKSVSVWSSCSISVLWCQTHPSEPQRRFIPFIFFISPLKKNGNFNKLHFTPSKLRVPVQTGSLFLQEQNPLQPPFQFTCIQMGKVEARWFR